MKLDRSKLPGTPLFRLNRDGLGHPATGAWKVCPRCRVVFRNLSASDVRPPADGRGMPVRTGREERGYGHTDGGARADGVSGMAA